MILSVGEILLDVYSEEKSSVLEMNGKIGGAPFNVAANVAKNHGDVSFYGAIGKDGFGSFLEKEAKAYPFKKLVLEKTEYPTTLAIVSLVNGERSFSFLRGADFHLHSKKLETLPLNIGDILHLGSLMLSEEEGARFFLNAVSFAKRKGAYVSFDMNLRLDIFQNEKEARYAYENVFPDIDFLKVSEDELQFLGMTPEELKNHCMKKKSVLFVTHSSKGSDAYIKNEHYSIPSRKIDVVDSTGAGDAFFARVLLELDKASDPFSLSREKWEELLMKANEDGAQACLHKGALE